jgi:hypothetical protein
MSASTLERRVAILEGAVAVLEEQVKQVAVPAKKGILSIVGSMADMPGFDDVVAYGRYFRVTGKEAPPDWNPGDPIPEPEYEE